MRGAVRLTTLRAGLVLTDAAALAAALGAAYLLRFRWEVGALESVTAAPFSEYLKPLSVLLLLVPLLFQLLGLYRTDGVHSGVDELYVIIKSVSAGAALV